MFIIAYQYKVKIFKRNEEGISKEKLKTEQFLTRNFQRITWKTITANRVKMAQYKNNTQKSIALFLVRNRLQITEIIQTDISRRWFCVCGSQSHWKGWRNRTSAVIVCVLSHFSRVQPFATPWTVACQAPLFTGFYRQEYWSGLPFPPPGDLSHPGIQPMSHVSHHMHWPADFLPLAPPGKPCAVMDAPQFCCRKLLDQEKWHHLLGTPLSHALPLYPT